MQIFVKTQNGTRAMQIERNAAVVELQELIEINEGIPKDFQRLVSSGKIVNLESNLYDAQIQEGQTIELLLTLKGGAGDQKMDPAFVALVEKYIYNKKICRKCFGTNSIKARVCRKRKCGHCSDLRLKKQLKAK